mmetsp:Transcript_43704/g.98807  ORF Transcript_43704/g.98807 Transcript_43704/m.98807 type:complete len:211 (-) Transcript_43704:989-1621(-)
MYGSRKSPWTPTIRSLILILLGLWVVVLFKVTGWSGQPLVDHNKVDEGFNRPLLRRETGTEAAREVPEKSRNDPNAVQGPIGSDAGSSLHESRSFLEPHCPEVPDKNYPMDWPIMDVVKNWNPDVTEIPPKIHSSLCRFDYVTQLDIARAYRNAEVPFVVRNVPKMASTVHNWANLDYLAERLGRNKSYLAEYSATNHFMYYSRRGNGII